MARKRTPATTPEQQENRLIAAAVDLAAKQLEEGTASAQVITHFLKLGSSREKLEQEQLSRRNELLQAQREALEAAGRIEELIGAAVTAFKSYQSTSSVPMEELTYVQDS